MVSSEGFVGERETELLPAPDRSQVKGNGLKERKEKTGKEEEKTRSRTWP